MQKNITLDFTKISSFENQPVAIMPEFLAKKLLTDFAERLGRTSLSEVKRQLVRDIEETNNENELIDTVTQFIQIRELVANVVEGQWDAYSTIQTAIP